MELYVGNLPFSIDDTSLNALFSPFGDVRRAKVMTDRDSGRSRGFGFVTMGDTAAGQAAINGLNGTDQGGRPMTVRVAEPRQPRSGGPGGPGGPRGGYGGSRY